MNCYELQALRKLFMLDVSEAAELVGKVSARTWQYWEAGRSPVPADVAEEMLFWNSWRDDLLELRIEQCGKEPANAELISLNYYKTLDDFEERTGKRNVVTWRLSQSIAAQLYSERLCNLVDQGGLAIDD